LENASRFKTIEQKVREAQAWKDVETEKSRARKLSKLRQNSSTPVTPDLASREKGETREKVAKLVGLKRTTYEKAAKVVRAIDTEINHGNLEHAITLRKILNEQSVDAALQVLKQPGDERYQILSLIGTSKAKNPKEARALLQQSQNAAPPPGSHYTNPGSDQPQTSCWTCQHRLEVIDKHCIYCNKFGILNLIDKSGNERGQECSEWKDRCSPLELLEKPSFVLKLFLPVEWQNRLEEAAASFGLTSPPFEKGGFQTILLRGLKTPYAIVAYDMFLHKSFRQSQRCPYSPRLNFRPVVALLASHDSFLPVRVFHRD